jgi:hypothetical protein
MRLYGMTDTWAEIQAEAPPKKTEFIARANVEPVSQRQNNSPLYT